MIVCVLVYVSTEVTVTVAIKRIQPADAFNFGGTYVAYIIRNMVWNESDHRNAPSLWTCDQLSSCKVPLGGDSHIANAHFLNTSR